MKKEIKTAVNKLRLKNTLGVEEDLATYVDGVSGVWIPPQDGTELTKWYGFNDCHQRIVEASLILGIDDLFAGGHLEWEKKIRGIWYTVPERLQENLEKGRDPDVLVNGSIGFQQSLISAGWHYKYLQPVESKRLKQYALG